MTRNFFRHSVLTLILLGFVAIVRSQNGDFDVAGYQSFLTANQNLTYEQLNSRFNLPSLSPRVSTDISSAAYLDSISIKYELTDSEFDLIVKHGFVVTERLSWFSFGEALLDIYQKDLPVFISTDAILFALHKSYDGLLSDLEATVLKPKLSDALRIMQEAWEPLWTEFSADPEMRSALNDVDVYLTVARRLLENNDIPSVGDNSAEVEMLLTLIENQQPADYPLFNEHPRLIDFSQFKPRGHYDRSDALRSYFKAMMWLGRTEFRLTSPEEPGFPPIDVTREIVDAYLVLELVQRSGALGYLDEIDQVLRFMVAESDNVTLSHLNELSSEIALQSPAELWKPEMQQEFEEALLTKPFADQRINSQILFSDPMNPEQVRPPSAFLLMGQRFLIDSFILGNVVYDKILFQNSKIWRELPTPLDALFVMGNDAVLPLLKGEISDYKYASNLNALRYLVDSFGNDFWESSLTNTWLNAIRDLNDRTHLASLPDFMKTGAWQQQKMNTQLAAWAELRHDNLLYAKQSSTLRLSKKSLF